MAELSSYAETPAPATPNNIIPQDRQGLATLAFDTAVKPLRESFNKNLTTTFEAQAQRGIAFGGQGLKNLNDTVLTPQINAEAQIAGQIGTQMGMSLLDQAFQSSEAAKNRQFQESMTNAGYKFQGAENQANRDAAAASQASSQQFQGEAQTSQQIYEATQAGYNRQQQLALQSGDQAGAQALMKLQQTGAEKQQLTQQEYGAAQAALDRQQQLAIQNNDIAAQQEIAKLQASLQKDIIGVQQSFTAAQAALDRSFTAAENSLGRAFTTEERTSAQDYASAQALADRAQQLKVQGNQLASDAAQQQADQAFKDLYLQKEQKYGKDMAKDAMDFQAQQADLQKKAQKDDIVAQQNWEEKMTRLNNEFNGNEALAQRTFAAEQAVYERQFNESTQQKQINANADLAKMDNLMRQYELTGEVPTGETYKEPIYETRSSWWGGSYQVQVGTKDVPITKQTLAAKQLDAQKASEVANREFTEKMTRLDQQFNGDQALAQRTFAAEQALLDRTLTQDESNKMREYQAAMATGTVTVNGTQQQTLEAKQLSLANQEAMTNKALDMMNNGTMTKEAASQYVNDFFGKPIALTTQDEVDMQRMAAASGLSVADYQRTRSAISNGQMLDMFATDKGKVFENQFTPEMWSELQSSGYIDTNGRLLKDITDSGLPLKEGANQKLMNAYNNRVTDPQAVGYYRNIGDYIETPESQKKFQKELSDSANKAAKEIAGIQSSGIVNAANISGQYMVQAAKEGKSTGSSVVSTVCYAQGLTSYEDFMSVIRWRAKLQSTYFLAKETWTGYQVAFRRIAMKGYDSLFIAKLILFFFADPINAHANHKLTGKKRSLKNIVMYRLMWVVAVATYYLNKTECIKLEKKLNGSMEMYRFYKKLIKEVESKRKAVI